MFYPAIATAVKAPIVEVTRQTSSSATYPNSHTIITSFTAGSETACFWPGQSVTTSPGSSWDHLIFSWFSDGDGLARSAFGTLFLLSQEYQGMPAALNANTPGYIAQAAAMSGETYQFDPTIALQPDQQYFFYTNASGRISGANFGGYPRGILYNAFSAADRFVKDVNLDANFALSGLAVAKSQVA